MKNPSTTTSSSTCTSASASTSTSTTSSPQQVQVPTNTINTHANTNISTLLDRIWFFLKPSTWIGILQALNEQIPNSKDLLYVIAKTLLTDVAIPFLLLKVVVSLLPSSLSLSLSKDDYSNCILKVASSTATAKSTSTSMLFPPPTSSQNHYMNIAMITLASPFTIHGITQRILPSGNIFTTRMKLWKILRIPPSEDAVQCLNNGIMENEIVRTKLFDIYFPPMSSSTSSPLSYNNDVQGNVNENENEYENGQQQNKEKIIQVQAQAQKLYMQPSIQKAILFLPGAFIDHTSYSQIAKSMSRKGFLVVVPSFEPTRLAVKYFGATKGDMRRIMDCAHRQWVTKLNQMNRLNIGGDTCSESGNGFSGRNKNMVDGYDTLIQWSIGGHSYGAYAAMRLSPEIKELLVDSRPDPNTKQNQKQDKRGRRHYRNHRQSQTNLKLFIWAAGNIDHLVPNLSKFDSSELEVLVVLASNDTYCKFSLDSNNNNNDSGSTIITLPKFLSKLPPLAKCTIIKGGTHNNFASYNASEQFNGVPDISRERQHQLVVDATTDFLLL